MKNRGFRILAAVLAAVLLVGLAAPGITPTVSAAQAVPHVPTFENTYVNTGIQRLDILGVALTQMDYMEGNNNDTKYGTWYGLPYNPWCAMFITWCAR